MVVFEVVASPSSQGPRTWPVWRKAFQVQRWEMVIDAPLRASCLLCFWVLPAVVSCLLHKIMWMR